MASLADLLTRLQDMEAAQGGTPKAPWRGPGERPTPGVNEPDPMPKWYRDVQPYPVNVPAAIEGLGAMAGVTGGPANAVTGGIKAVAGSPLAQKLAGSAALTLGLASPSMANKDEKPADKSMAPANQAYMDLLKQSEQLQSAANQAKAKRDAASATREVERRSGVGPRFAAAEKAFQDADLDYQDLSARAKATQAMASKEAEKLDPAYQLKMKQEEDKVAEEKKRRTMNTSVKEMFSDVAPYAPAVSAALGMAAGNAIKGSYVKKFNTNANEINSRWQTAAQGTNKGLAEALQEEAKALAKKGPGGTWPAISTGIAIGEIGQVIPVASDYAKAVPGSDLYNKTMEGMSNPWDVGGRMLTGALLGGLPAKIGSSLAGRHAVRPTGYAAETRAMQGPEPSPPPSSQGLPNVPGPQGSGTSTMSPQGPAGTAANSNSGSLSRLLRDGVKSGELTTQDVLASVGIKPANQAANPAGLPKHLTQDDRLSGSKIRNKETGRIEPDPLKTD